MADWENNERTLWQNVRTTAKHDGTVLKRLKSHTIVIGVFDKPKRENDCDAALHIAIDCLHILKSKCLPWPRSSKQWGTTDAKEAAPRLLSRCQKSNFATTTRTTISLSTFVFFWGWFSYPFTILWALLMKSARLYLLNYEIQNHWLAAKLQTCKFVCQITEGLYEIICNTVIYILNTS